MTKRNVISEQKQNVRARSSKTAEERDDGGGAYR